MSNHIEEDRPEPPSLVEIAAAEGLHIVALRAALRQSHPDASPSEVFRLARSMAVHHIDGNPLNNDLTNLRLAPINENKSSTRSSTADR